MQGSSILFSEMTPPPAEEERFHGWYDREHIPVRMEVPGFLSAQRYAAANAPGFLAVYELAGPDVMASPAYQSVKKNPSDETRHMLSSVSGFTRYIANEISTRARAGVTGETALGAPILYAVWFDVPEEALPRFDAWYEQDHVPLLLDCPEWLMVRRFAVLDGEPTNANRLALHYLASHDALKAPEREKARGTPWRAKLAAEPWFKGTYSVFEQHAPRQVGRAR